jgi:hypothetical protein
MGLIKAVGRLFVMGGVIGAVISAALVAGLATTTAIAVGVVLAGTMGMLGVIRRPRPVSRSQSARAAGAIVEPGRSADPTTVEAMAPLHASVPDPEANMPRWRRPSLLEARRSDPTRVAPSTRMPMRFADTADGADLRVVRYAVVPILDRPDEVLGLQLSELGSGDEVVVVGTSGAFLNVLCPNGHRGWVHRTTVGSPVAAAVADDPDERRTVEFSRDADDALSALLIARGLI